MRYAGRSITDGSTSASSATLTSAGAANFTIADIGKFVFGSGIGSGTVILAVISSTQATMSQVAATTTASGLHVTITGPKILTLGVGVLTMHDLSLIDGVTDFAPFIQTTNTQLLLSNMAFGGSGTARLVGGVTVTSGSSAISTSSAAFSASDVNAPVFGLVTGSSPVVGLFPRNTLIQSFTDSQHVTANANASTTTSTGTMAVCSNFQDAIVLGGTGTYSDGTANGQFQGYGTVIEKCLLSKIRRGGFFRATCNGVVFRDSNFQSNCAGGSADGAIHIDGRSAGFPNGANVNFISGNIVEDLLYQNAFLLNVAAWNTILGNSLPDPLGSQNGYYIQSNAKNNFILATVQPGYNDIFEQIPGSNLLIDPSVTGQFQLPSNGTARLGVFGNGPPVVEQVVTGSKGGNAALASLIAALVAYGLIEDTTT
jgi:hypothetical protein